MYEKLTKLEKLLKSEGFSLKTSTRQYTSEETREFREYVRDKDWQTFGVFVAFNPTTLDVEHLDFLSSVLYTPSVESTKRVLSEAEKILRNQ